LDFGKRLADCLPVDVAVADFAEPVRLAPVLHVELDDPMAEGADPVFAGTELADVADIEVGTHPGTIDLVEIVAHLLWFFAESIPHILDEHADAEFARGWDDTADLLDRSFPDVVVGLI